MFWNKKIGRNLSPIIDKIRNGKRPSYKLVVAALLGLLAALFQSAGGVIPGVGYLISPFSTTPIIVSFLIGISYGLSSYVLTIFLLLFLQPSELLIFPFTTGILGVGIGIGIYLFKRRIAIILPSCMFLAAGVCLLLYGLQFPIVGPFLTEPTLPNLAIFFVFSFLYSWAWVEFALRYLAPVKR